MRVKELNIKQDMPPADVAVANMEIEIEALTGSDVGAIKVIHGYGSHGTGGEIRNLARARLKELKKLGKIFDYVEGEKWGQGAVEKFHVVENYPQFILESDMQSFNSGITIIFLNTKK